MQVSRPTFMRMYISAREKIARAFVEGRQIIIEGGKIEYDMDWFSCRSCGCVFSKKTEIPRNCPVCGSFEINQYKTDNK